MELTQCKSKRGEVTYSNILKYEFRKIHTRGQIRHTNILKQIRICRDRIAKNGCHHHQHRQFIKSHWRNNISVVHERKKMSIVINTKRDRIQVQVEDVE